MKSIHHYWQTLNFVSVVLAPISAVFCLLVAIRRTLYQIGLLKSISSQLPIIVVGNIYIGGNGKTPFVIWLAEQLKSKGYRPGIVSRGYGALSEQQSGHSWPRQVDLNQNHQLYGDEPLLIHQATQCPVVIDPVRNRAVKKLQQDTNCNVIISDDGLQHYAMSRFIEINITDAQRLYGNNLCLPAGPLREARGRLKTVDYIVYNVSRNKETNLDDSDSKKHFTMDYKVQSLIPLVMNSNKADDGQTMTLEQFQGKIVHAVAGIGEPDNFFNLLKQSGLTVIEHSFADHHQYQLKDFCFETSHPIIMTEKDAVKCRDFDLPRCWYLPIKAEIDNKLSELLIRRLKTFQLAGN